MVISRGGLHTGEILKSICQTQKGFDYEPYVFCCLLLYGQAVLNSGDQTQPYKGVV